MSKFEQKQTDKKNSDWLFVKYWFIDLICHWNRIEVVYPKSTSERLPIDQCAVWFWKWKPQERIK